MVPSINPDGRALNPRGNSHRQDLNRDHALIEQAETKGYAAMLRDYTPDVSIDNHEGDSEDLPILSARHLNVYEPLFNEGKSMVNEWMYGAAAQSGWWMGPYSTGGDSHEGILRNTGALKNGVSMLGEARAAAGNTRPAEGASNSRAEREPQGLRPPVGELGGHAVLQRPQRPDRGAQQGVRGGYQPGDTSRARRSCAAPTRGRSSRASARTRTTSRTSTRRWPRGSSTRRRAGTSSRRPSTRCRARAISRRRRPGRQRRAAPGDPRHQGRAAAGGVLVPLRQPLRGLIAPILDARRPCR